MGSLNVPLTVTLEKLFIYEARILQEMPEEKEERQRSQWLNNA